jgi:hypothetical protein
MIFNRRKPPLDGDAFQGGPAEPFDHSLELVKSLFVSVYTIQQAADQLAQTIDFGLQELRDLDVVAARARPRFVRQGTDLP